MSDSMKNGELNPERWAEIFEEFEKDYKDAYYSVDKAVKLDEEGKSTEALPFYEFGLNLIDKALDIPIIEPAKPDLSWEKAVVMTQKLKKTRKEILIRIENVKSKPQPEATEPPPSYEDVIASSKTDSAGTSASGNNCGNDFQLPGPSKPDVPYIPPSAMQDETLLANLHDGGEGSSEASVTYSDLSNKLKEMKLAKRILFRCDNVQMYFISPDGRVSSTSQPSTMIIARVYDATSRVLDEALNSIVNDLFQEIHENKKKRHRHSLIHKKHHHHHHHKNKKYKRKKDDESDSAVRTYLQVDSWIYPLIPKVSFCLRHDARTFVFPDINSNLKGAAVGLIIPEEVVDEVHEFFSEFLNQPATEEKSRSKTPDFAPDTYTSTFLRGTAYLAHYLVKGASTAANFIDSSTPKIINRITPQPEPQPINPKVKKTVEVAKTMTGKAVDVTDYLASKVCSATLALGRYLSPYVQKQGTQLLTLTTNTTEEAASEKMKSVINATSKTFEGISTVYSGLETAVSILSRSLANNTVQIIEYKYGQAAGALTDDAITTLGNVYYTRQNCKYLKPKGIAKSTLKGTGQALLEDSRKSDTGSKYDSDD